MGEKEFARVVSLGDLDAARQALEEIGCDAAGVAIMCPKAVFRVVKVEKLRTKAANLLKQTFLGKGGDVAVSRHTADLTAERTDALIFATEKQYRSALVQLKAQPWGLAGLAKEIESVLQYKNTPLRRTYRWKDRMLEIADGRSLVMGILNLTPDSFSDGGKFNRPDAALRRLEEMQADGADIIDIGAESTRPYGGAQKVSAAEELDRLLPVLDELLPHCSVPVSIDTYKPQVADAALRAGAHIINDIWGLQLDPAMAQVAARHGAPVVVMHNQEAPVYPGGVLPDVLAFLRRSIKIGIENGVPRENIIVDPGIGFAKTWAQNAELLQALDQLGALGCPVLLGASRKRFIGETLNLPVEERLEGTLAATALGKVKGAHIHRVHDVKEVKRMLRMLDAILMRSGENGKDLN